MQSTTKSSCGASQQWRVVPSIGDAAKHNQVLVDMWASVMSAFAAAATFGEDHVAIVKSMLSHVTRLIKQVADKPAEAARAAQSIAILCAATRHCPCCGRSKAGRQNMGKHLGVAGWCKRSFPL